MKKLLLISLVMIFSALLYNSCQKEQAKAKSNDEVQATTSAKAETFPGETSSGLPDLTIDAERLGSSVVVRTKVFKANDCVVSEGCVAAPGKRKLLRFDVATPNIGDADLFLGSPIGNPLFEYSPCHRHYHFNGYADYELLNLNGTNILTGRKQAFCLEDFARYYTNAGPAKYTCSYQGISVGWQDIYGSYLDCQWLDVTDFAPGNYLLRVTINPQRILAESNYENNSATVPVTITK